MHSLLTVGLGKGAGQRKAKAPLAEQKIDPVSMPLKTIIKVACAKDKVKTAAAKAAKVSTITIAFVRLANLLDARQHKSIQDYMSVNTSSTAAWYSKGKVRLLLTT